MPWTEWDDETAAEQRQAAAIAANEAFVEAMNRAIRYRQVKARPGTFVDPTPPINAKRIRTSLAISGCSSPAAACIE